MPRKPKLVQPQVTGKVQGRDLFKTPDYATELLLPYIPGNIMTIWEPAAGEHHITKVLIRHGYKVFESDIDGNSAYHDFVTDPSDAFGECIITNPPFSLKKQFFMKCVEYEIPFALLIPADYCLWTIDAIRYYRCEKIIPTRRINYITPNNVPNSSAYFHSLWLTRYFNLGCTETFVDLK